MKSFQVVCVAFCIRKQCSLIKSMPCEDCIFFPFKCTVSNIVHLRSFAIYTYEYGYTELSYSPWACSYHTKIEIRNAPHPLQSIGIIIRSIFGGKLDPLTSINVINFSLPHIILNSRLNA